MTIFDPHQKELHAIAEAQRKVAVSNRMGVVKEVKQAGGEQKIRCVIGVDPNGKELLGPWMSTVDKRGATREQHQYKKGQNVRITGADGDYRQATVSAWAEGESFPQPDHAEDHGYGDSYQAGKLHTGNWMPNDDDDQQGGDKNHRHEVWIAKEDNKPPKHSGQFASEEQETGDGQQQQPEQQQQQKQKKKPEAAMMMSLDEKNGFTARVGTDVRVAVHSNGAKIRAGNTYFAAGKDSDAFVRANANVYVKSEALNFVDKPWVIRDPPRRAFRTTISSATSRRLSWQ